MLAILSFLALLAAAGARGGTAPPLIPGSLIEGFHCSSDPTQSYTLYLPSAYDASRQWPVLLVFDPRGRGTLGAELFRPAAERFGWIVVSSNDTRSDGPWEPNQRAVNALWPEVHTRFRSDPQRIYAAGFSGGVAVAWGVAGATGQLAGVIAACGRIAEGLAPEVFNCPMFGTTGDADFNFLEMRAMDDLLERRGIPHRLEVFAGRHSWMPQDLATEAVAWMELQAMRRGSAPRNEAMIARSYVAELMAAREASDGERAIDTWRHFRAIVGTYEGLCDVREAKTRMEGLEQDPRVAADRKEERDWDRFERDEQQRLVRFVADVRGHEAVTPGSAMRMLDLDRLSELARRDDYAGSSATRALEEIFVQCAFYLTRDFLAAKRYDHALLVLEIALRIHGDAPFAWYNTACAEARLG